MSNNIEKVVKILVSPFQRIANTLHDMKTMMDIENGVGAQLTMVGNKVGQPRHGITDDEKYRRFCRARVRVNRSQGTGEDLIAVASLALSDLSPVVILRPPGDASIEVDVTSVTIDEATASILLELLLEAASAGVRITLAYAVSASAGLFRFDSGPGFDVGHLAGGKDYTSP